MSRPSFETFATALILLCAISVSGLAARRYFDDARVRRPASSVTTEKNWRKFAVDGRSLGPADARVTIVEFSDFQCPFCRKFASYRDSLHKLGWPVRVLYRHMPTPSHRHAVQAAVASECAAEQGRFEAMHDSLFAHSDSLGIIPWWSLARSAGVTDSAGFDTCLSGNSMAPRLALDSAAARELRVQGTPTLLIHSVRVNGVPGFDSLLAYVRRAATEGSPEPDPMR